MREYENLGFRKYKHYFDYFETNPEDIPLSIYVLAFHSLIYALLKPNLRDIAIKLVELIFSPTTEVKHSKNI